MIGYVETAKINYLKELPGKYVTEEYTGPLEISCAQGSVATSNGDLIVHVHVQLSSQEMSRGGYLAEARVFSAAEVVIGELDYQLRRGFDEYTGLNELKA